MICVVQRVAEAVLRRGDEELARIGRGLLVLAGFARGDQEAQLRWCAHKIPRLRVFEDDAGKMNFSLLQIHGELLLMSQFTLLGDVRRGLRPDFTAAERPERAKVLYDRFHALLEEELQREVPRGPFGAYVQIALVNDGPVTLLLEAKPDG